MQPQNVKKLFPTNISYILYRAIRNGELVLSWWSYSFHPKIEEMMTLRDFLVCGLVLSTG